VLKCHSIYNKQAFFNATHIIKIVCFFKTTITFEICSNGGKKSVFKTKLKKINNDFFVKKPNITLYLSGKLNFSKLSVILDWKASMNKNYTILNAKNVIKIAGLIMQAGCKVADVNVKKTNR